MTSSTRHAPRLEGLPFWKMSGSGNDFVFFDTRDGDSRGLDGADAIAAICARGTGVGADGVVLLEPATGSAFGIRYFNSDGSLASLCGNASLCSVRLAVELGAAPASGFVFETGAGQLAGRIRDGLPEIDLQPVTDVRPDAGIERLPGERRLGFALAGVPHLTALVDDVSAVDVVGRGRPLRRHASLRQGANVNFVSRADEGWQVRTYERGVEGETLACGTGAVASAILLTAWGEATGSVSLRTRSGQELVVTLRREGHDRWLPSLRGEGRIVFQGTLDEL